MGIRARTSSLRRAVVATAIIWVMTSATPGRAGESELQAAPSPRSAGGDRPTLVGPIDRSDLKTAPYSEWFESQYSQYQPSEASLLSLRGRLAGISIEAYFGTWCGDSRRQIPRLLRLLDLAGFDEQRLTLIGLSDREKEFKQAPGNPEAKRGVHRTPTIVLVREGIEVGRIVETPAASLEADVLAILEGHGPEPKYGAEAFVHHLFTDLSPAEAEKALQSAGPEILKRSDPDSLPHYAEQDLLKNGRAREAKALLDLHLQLNPRSVVGHILMSDALIALGRKAEATLALERALVIEPGNYRALRAAEKLRNP
jgi:tetratricopeptide (TPR) repeat protein